MNVLQTPPPPEASLLTAESPLHFRRMIDMFLSRGDFDPTKYTTYDQEWMERLQIKQQEVNEISIAAEEARKSAIIILQRTNDISDTLKRMRQ